MPNPQRNVFICMLMMSTLFIHKKNNRKKSEVKNKARFEKKSQSNIDIQHEAWQGGRETSNTNFGTHFSPLRCILYQSVTVLAFAAAGCRDVLFCFFRHLFLQECLKRRPKSIPIKNQYSQSLL